MKFTSDTRNASASVVVAVKTADLQVTIGLVSIRFNKQNKSTISRYRTKAHRPSLRCRCLAVLWACGVVLDVLVVPVNCDCSVRDVNVESQVTTGHECYIVAIIIP